MSDFLPPYHNKRFVNKSDLGHVLGFVKSRIRQESDEFKKQAWAEVGLELNKIYLHLGIK